MEVQPTASTRAADPIDAQLDRVEAAVAAGNTDLRALGFWSIVRRVKLDRLLVDEHAEQIGTIDAAAFRKRVRVRVPVWLGNAILCAGIVVGALAVVAAFVWQTPMWKGAALIAAGVVWSGAVHSPTHWLAGTLVGIRWTEYFVGAPVPWPGLKSDYGSYLRADADSRAWMHASGALATKLAPFVALAFWPGSDAPWWAAATLLGLGLLAIVTDVVISRRASDWKKFAREKAIARERRAALAPGAPPEEAARVIGGPQIPAPARPVVPAEPLDGRR